MEASQWTPLSQQTRFVILKLDDEQGIHVVNGCVFVVCLIEEREREKESGSVPEEGGEAVAKEDGVKEGKKKNKKKKKKDKKKKKKKKELDEKEEGGEDVVTDGFENENGEEGEEKELDFWMPPDGERWDFDDGGDRWGSDSEEEEEEPIGLFTCVYPITSAFGIMASCLSLNCFY